MTKIIISKKYQYGECFNSYAELKEYGIRNNLRTEETLHGTGKIFYDGKWRLVECRYNKLNKTYDVYFVSK